MAVRFVNLVAEMHNHNSFSKAFRSQLSTSADLALLETIRPRTLVTETLHRGFQRRQCARQIAQLHFTVGGVDEEGKFFEEPVVTADISECGGSFSSTKEIPVGATLKLSAPKGFLSLIKIAWHRKHQPSSPVNYGFSFLNPLEEEFTYLARS